MENVIQRRVREWRLIVNGHSSSVVAWDVRVECLRITVLTRGDGECIVLGRVLVGTKIQVRHGDDETRCHIELDVDIRPDNGDPPVGSYKVTSVPNTVRSSRKYLESSGKCRQFVRPAPSLAW